MALRPDRTIVTIAEARAILDASGTPIARTETVALHHLSGRVLGCDLDATMDVPPFARAAMDGYAVLAADTTGAREDAPVTLGLADSVYTGDAPGHHLAPGCCTGIATGAPVPHGADAVVMIEQTTREGDLVRIRVAARPGQNIGRRGSDVQAGHRECVRDGAPRRHRPRRWWQLRRRTRLRPRDHRGAGDRPLSGHRDQAGQAHNPRDRGSHAGVRDARQSDVLPVECIPARCAAAAHDRPAAPPERRCDPRAADEAGVFTCGPAPVLSGPPPGR